MPSQDVKQKTLIEEICSSIGHPEISDTALDVLSTSYEKGIFDGRSNDVATASSILVSCKIRQVPVTADDVAEKIPVDKGTLLNVSRGISSVLDSVEPLNWKVFLDYALSELEVSSRVVERAYEIGKTGEDKKLHSGRKPQAYAGSALYASSKIENRATGITQRKISDLLSVSVSTIRQTYKLLIQNYKDV